MQRVPWMCWKRTSDNWKAYILAYAWPMPISSRILWSLLFQNHFKLNRDFFFSSCQLETCEILSISVFVLLGNGQVLERNQEQELAGTLYSSWVQPSHQQLPGMREDMVYVVGRRKMCLAKTKLRAPSSSWPLTFASYVRILPGTATFALWRRSS